MDQDSKPSSVMLVCIIYGKDFLDRLLESFLDIGIAGATVLQSQGMGKILSREIPLFAGLKELLETGGPNNYTVLSVVHDPSLIEKLIKQVPELKQGEQSKGVLFTVPVAQFVKFDNLH